MDIVIASNNKDKVKEIREIFVSEFFVIHDLSEFPSLPEVLEDGNTLKENAFKKAKAVFESLKIPAIADDTGLEVDALHGAPGIYAARYAGESATYEDNVRKLLVELKDVPPSNRRARFRCVAAFYSNDYETFTEGTVEGRIINPPRGKNGFGYDPVFFLPGLNKTFAEMTPAEKHAISHRGLAFRKLYKVLSTHYHI